MVRPTAAPPSEVPRPALTAARGIAHLLDDCRIDPVLGLVLPGIGDALAGLMGLSIVGIAIRAGAPKVILARMLINIAADMLLGSIPLVGDVFDFWFPANTMNVRLLERATDARRTSAVDYLVLSGAGALFLAALILPVVAAAFALRALWHRYR